MPVKLLNYTPLWVADKAIGKCWDKPTPDVVDFPGMEVSSVSPGCNTERIERVANKHKHSSTIEHLNYTFDITMSRACLQEWARHRMASLSVKSSRYTLKELKESEDLFTYLEEPSENGESTIVNYDIVNKYCVLTTNSSVNFSIALALESLKDLIKEGVANDKAKYCMPEAYKTSMVWTVNARSLQNFLALRTSKAALWEIRDIAHAVYSQIPKDHRFLFKDSVNKIIKDNNNED